MNTTVSKTALAAIISAAMPYAPTRTTIPVLGNLLLVTQGSNLTVTGYDLNTSITITLPVMPGVDGAITVPGKLLNDLLGLLPQDSVTLTTDATKMQLLLAAGTVRHRIMGIDPDDYPTPPNLDSFTDSHPKRRTTVLTIPAAKLAATISNVEHAVSVDMSRNQLTHMETVLKKGLLTFSATDGYRLARRQIAVADNDEADEQFLIPGSSLRSLLALLAAAPKKSDVTLTLVSNVGNPRLFATTEEPDTGVTNLVGLGLAEDRFPDYKAVIPKTHKVAMTVDRRTLIRMIKAAGLYARTNNNIVKFTINRPVGDMATLGTLTVSAKSAEIGDFEETIDAKVEFVGEAHPEGYSASYNTRYMLDALGAIATDEVRMTFTDATRPVTVHAEPRINDTDIDVVMPMHPPRE
jgi:DNA polymerase III subunit beta